MKVTGWTYWGNEKYWPCDDLSSPEWEKARQAVIEEIRKNGCKLCGYSHQDPEVCGVPIIDEKYRFEVSMRSWGRIMAEAYGNMGMTDYCEWAWDNPEPEVLPCK